MEYECTFWIFHALIYKMARPFQLENENIIFSAHERVDPDYVFMGYYIKQGRKTQQNILIKKDNFSQSCGIFGQQGTGKTYLIAQILQEFYEKQPDVGILVINLGKGNQEKFYPHDQVLRFGSDLLQIPYFVEGKYFERCIQETAAYLIASLGLKNIVEKNMVTVMKSFLEKKGFLPNSIKVLFNNLVRYFEKFPYHARFQANITRAIKNRVATLFSNRTLLEVMEVSHGTPTWFKEWRNGKEIFLDLSMCTVYEKRLLCNAIFQIVRALTPDIELGKLKNIIVIDEAHQILEKPVTNNYDDDDYIARDQLQKIFNELLREFRSKGLSFMIADQTPSRLFDSVITLPSLKFIFRVGYPCNTKFVGKQEEQEYLTLQKNRQVLVVNGITGEKYIMRNNDVKIDAGEESEEVHYVSENEICPYCFNQVEVEKDSQYCEFCGEKIRN